MPQVKGGHKAVFVCDAGSKVYKISDSAKAAKFRDKKVKVNGGVKCGIELASIAYAE